MSEIVTSRRGTGSVGANLPKKAKFERRGRTERTGEATERVGAAVVNSSHVAVAFRGRVDCFTMGKRDMEVAQKLHLHLGRDPSKDEQNAYIKKTYYVVQEEKESEGKAP